MDLAIAVCCLYFDKRVLDLDHPSDPEAVGVCDGRV